MTAQTASALDAFLAHPRINSPNAQVTFQEDGLTYAGILFHAFVKYGVLCFVVDWCAEKGQTPHWTPCRANFTVRLDVNQITVDTKNGHTIFTHLVGLLTVNLDGEKLFQTDPQTGDVVDPDKSAVAKTSN